MSKNSLGKYERPNKNSNLYKKVRKEYLQEPISLLYLPANSDVLTHMPREVQQEVIFALLQYHLAQHVKNNLELQVVLLMEDELRDDGKMLMEEQKIRSELWV